MFVKNKYYRWYYQIVTRARKRGVPEWYFEKHHVIPKCMGGKNTEWNVVSLTFREHFIVHWLLTKMTNGEVRKKMLFALLGMTSSHRWKKRKVTSWMYHHARVAAQKVTLRGKLPPEYKERWLTALRQTYFDKREKECGHADWRKCVYCKQYDSPNNLFIGKSVFHRECRNIKYKALKEAKRRAGLIHRKNSALHSQMQSILSKEQHRVKREEFIKRVRPVIEQVKASGVFSKTMIAKELNRMGISTYKGSSVWTYDSVVHVMRNGYLYEV